MNHQSEMLGQYCGCPSMTLVRSPEFTRHGVQGGQATLERRPVEFGFQASHGNLQGHLGHANFRWNLSPYVTIKKKNTWTIQNGPKFYQKGEFFVSNLPNMQHRATHGGFKSISPQPIHSRTWKVVPVAIWFQKTTCSASETIHVCDVWNELKRWLIPN